MNIYIYRYSLVAIPYSLLVTPYWHCLVPLGTVRVGGGMKVSFSTRSAGTISPIFNTSTSPTTYGNDHPQEGTIAIHPKKGQWAGQYNYYIGPY